MSNHEHWNQHPSRRRGQGCGRLARVEGNHEKFAKGREVIRKRGIYLFPNLLTSGALFAGFYAIVAGADGEFERAAVSLFVAMVLDALDGRVARLTGTVTEFGRQYDSLSDMVAFGLGPAVVMYQWGLAHLGSYGWIWDKIGWIIAFLFAVGTAMRLARFTARGDATDRTYFEGLPSPAAAGWVAGLVWLAADSAWSGFPVLVLCSVVTLAAAVLMCVRIAYPSFKHLAENRRIRFTQLAAIPACFALIALDPPRMLFTLFGVYVALGPCLLLWRMLRKRKHSEMRKAVD